MQDITSNHVKALAGSAVGLIMIVALTPWWVPAGLIAIAALGGWLWWRQRDSGSETTDGN